MLSPVRLSFFTTAPSIPIFVDQKNTAREIILHGRRIVIKPGRPECIDDSGFLRFENEYVIDVAAKWILPANAADAIVRSGI